MILRCYNIHYYSTDIHLFYIILSVLLSPINIWKEVGETRIFSVYSPNDYRTQTCLKYIRCTYLLKFPVQVNFPFL